MRLAGFMVAMSLASLSCSKSTQEQTKTEPPVAKPFERMLTAQIIEKTKDFPIEYQLASCETGTPVTTSSPLVERCREDIQEAFQRFSSTREQIVFHSAIIADELRKEGLDASPVAIIEGLSAAVGPHATNKEKPKFGIMITMYVEERKSRKGPHAKAVSDIKAVYEVFASNNSKQKTSDQ